MCKETMMKTQPAGGLPQQQKPCLHFSLSVHGSFFFFFFFFLFFLFSLVVCFSDEGPLHFCPVGVVLMVSTTVPYSSIPRTSLQELFPRYVFFIFGICCPSSKPIHSLAAHI
jgi:hypothetical protein